MYRASPHNLIDPPWTKMEPIRIGRVPAGRGTPDLFVTIERDEHPYARIDAYAENVGYFRELILWHRFVVLGWSDVVHFVDPAARRAQDISCAGYFGHLYPLESELLIASASELICVNAHAEELWRRDNLGEDGVVVERVADGVIHGCGEWDPPEAWRPFRVVLETGDPIAMPG